MNILHHKSWHVRTKKNIEKVRKDEQKALEEQTEKARKADLAEQERRIEQLRSKFNVNQFDQYSNKQLTDSQQASDVKQSTNVQQFAKNLDKQHINFFQNDYEICKNKAHELEKKIEQEQWEKKVGILTYLGGNQPTNLPWYERLPAKESAVSCKEASILHNNDPLNKIKEELNKRKKEEEDLNKKKNFQMTRFNERVNYKFNKNNRLNKNHSHHQIKDRLDKTQSYHLNKTNLDKTQLHHLSKTHLDKKSNKITSSQSSDSITSGQSNDNTELTEKELKLKMLRDKRLKREAKESNRSKNLFSNSSLFNHCLNDRQRAYSDQFNPHLARR